MKNTIKLFGIIAFVAVIGFSFAACGGDDDGGGGEGVIDPSNITNATDLATWLKAQPPNTPETAYSIKLNVDDLGGIGGIYSTAGSVGNALYSNRTKYVSLDLSGSTFTGIVDNAFKDCTNLVGITIGSGVTSIGWDAFSGCTSLTSVNIPDSVTSIGGFAFMDCSSLISITIPNSVTSIEHYTFSGCSSLTSVTIPDSVTSIGGSAFSGCTSLTSVTFEGTITANNFGTYSSYYSTWHIPFDGDLRDKYLAGGIGTYTRSGTTWTKQS